MNRIGMLAMLTAFLGIITSKIMIMVIFLFGAAFMLFLGFKAGEYDEPKTNYRITEEVINEKQKRLKEKAQ